MKALVFAGQTGRCVLYGDVERLPMPNEDVEVRNARMVLRVQRVGFLGLAAVGPQPGTDTRIGHAVARTTCTARQAAEVSDAAAAAIDAWPAWE